MTKAFRPTSALPQKLGTWILTVLSVRPNPDFTNWYKKETNVKSNNLKLPFTFDFL